MNGCLSLASVNAPLTGAVWEAKCHCREKWQERKGAKDTPGKFQVDTQ